MVVTGFMRRLIPALAWLLLCGCTRQAPPPALVSTVAATSPSPAASASVVAPPGHPVEVTVDGGQQVAVQVTDLKLGTGEEAEDGRTVSVRYVGTLPDGTKFDSTADHDDQPVTFELGAGRVIPGWEAGLRGMKVGGKRHLVIPPAAGYGSREMPGKIPANSTLIFDVELVDVK
ncbi:MAG: FKBP-type peptidyl-prolyl cis-trans isomerase [Candidatus Xenobia bacterium]